MTDRHKDSERAVHAPHFLVLPIEGGFEILYNGALFATIERDQRMPAGFVDRFVVHAMDLLSGRRSALWDEQAVYADKPFSRSNSRRESSALADLAAAARDRGGE